jgi:8-oxo-dGTP pyrophosphatase MutT (NUDIX family)
MPLTTAAIEQALGRRRPFRVPLGGRMQQAAVAAVARDSAGGAELLFIQRAERSGDPWSGHVAFPGGRLEPEDSGLQAAAERETREEIGLDLPATARPVGELAEVMAKAHGRPLPMVIRPFVYALAGAPPALRLSDEVQAVIWMPLSFLADRANRSTMTWRLAGVPIPMDCYRFEGQVLWGLTLRMVDELLALLGAPRAG